MDSGIVLAGASTLFVGVLIFLIRHTANSKKHPCKDDIVFDDVCKERGKRNEAEHKRLDDCIEAAIIRSNEQHIELKQNITKMDAKLDRLLEK